MKKKTSFSAHKLGKGHYKLKVWEDGEEQFAIVTSDAEAYDDVKCIIGGVPERMSKFEDPKEALEWLKRFRA